MFRGDEVKITKSEWREALPLIALAVVALCGVLMVCFSLPITDAHAKAVPVQSTRIVKGDIEVLYAAEDGSTCAQIVVDNHFDPALGELQTYGWTAFPRHGDSDTHYFAAKDKAEAWIEKTYCKI